MLSCLHWDDGSVHFGAFQCSGMQCRACTSGPQKPFWLNVSRCRASLSKSNRSYIDTCLVAAVDVEANGEGQAMPGLQSQFSQDILTPEKCLANSMEMGQGNFGATLHGSAGWQGP